MFIYYNSLTYYNINIGIYLKKGDKILAKSSMLSEILHHLIQSLLSRSTLLLLKTLCQVIIIVSSSYYGCSIYNLFGIWANPGWRHISVSFTYFSYSWVFWHISVLNIIALNSYARLGHSWPPSSSIYFWRSKSWGLHLCRQF